MPRYRIQLKQGKRTIVEHGEFKSLSAVLAHYELISTMKVTEVLKIEYENDTSSIPNDDFLYNSLFKGILKNEQNRISQQVIFHNIKLNKSERDIYDSIKMNMEIDGFHVDSIYCSLFKR